MPKPIEATTAVNSEDPPVIKSGDAHDAHEEALSHTEDEEDDEEEEDEEDEANQPLPVEYPGTIIPDDHPETIDADVDLTKDIKTDTDYIDLIHLKIHLMEDLDLGRFKQLESLCLRQNLLTLMLGIRALEPGKLEELDLYDNRIDHISSALNEFVNLSNLDLSFNKIKNIKNISNLTKLENLYFVQNKIKHIRNLELLVKLKNLELGGNKIETISETMLSLSSLTQLWLGKNRISKLQNLDNLVNLRVLSIQSNRLPKIEGLEKLVNLEELYLSHNGISKLEGLENNTKLTVIDVTANKISKLENLSHLTQLTDFWCSYNSILSFDEINRELGKLPELDTVYFEHNPIQTQNPTAYRRKLRLNLGPSLHKIDATYIHS